MKRLAAGVYCNDAGELHIIISELLLAAGYADTAENRETFAQAAREACARAGTPVTVLP